MKELSNYISEKLDINNVKISRWKEFEKVKPGDKGEDYNGEKGTVIEVGAAIELIPMDKYGSLQMCLDDGLIEDRDDCVIVKIHGEEIGYVYGPEGFVCYK